MLKNKWLIRIDSLQTAANNSGIVQVIELFDIVFCQNSLRIYKGVQDMPKLAFGELFDIFFI